CDSVSHQFVVHGDLRCFPTRRSSDLVGKNEVTVWVLILAQSAPHLRVAACLGFARDAQLRFGDLVQRPVGLFPELFERAKAFIRSEEHTSELQSRENLVCRLLLEKKK